MRKRGIFQIFFILLNREVHSAHSACRLLRMDGKSRNHSTLKKREQGAEPGWSLGWSMTSSPLPGRLSTSTWGMTQHPGLLLSPKSVSCMGYGVDDPFPAQLKGIRRAGAAEVAVALCSWKRQSHQVHMKELMSCLPAPGGFNSSSILLIPASLSPL